MIVERIYSKFLGKLNYKNEKAFYEKINFIIDNNFLIGLLNMFCEYFPMVCLYLLKEK